MLKREAPWPQGVHAGAANYHACARGRWVVRESCAQRSLGVVLDALGRAITWEGAHP